MAAFYILQQKAPFGYVAFDRCDGETHTETSVATMHNVENGSPITDHVRPDPAVLSVVLAVTNTPLDRDPDFGRGAPQLTPLFVSRWKPPFDGSPGSIFREAGLALRGGLEPEVLPVELFGPVAPYDRIAETEQKLLDLKKAAELVACKTLSREYRDMVITSFVLNRTNVGEGLFSIDMQQIRIVSTAQVAAPVPLEPRGAPMSKKGQQAPKTPTDAALSKSDLAAIIDFAKGAIGGAP